MIANHYLSASSYSSNHRLHHASVQFREHLLRYTQTMLVSSWNVTDRDYESGCLSNNTGMIDVVSHVSTAGKTLLMTLHE